MSKSAAPSSRSRRSKGRTTGKETPVPDAVRAGVLPCLFVSSQTVTPKSYLARKSETLFLNLQNLIERHGIGHIGFMTLTFVENLLDRVEAQRRFNSFATGFLGDHVREWIVAVERQNRGAIHYHLVCAFNQDIRHGFNFEACRGAVSAKKAGDYSEFKRLEKTYFASANKALRDWWTLVREKAPGYGFGRCETLPILSNSEALSRYVGAYVGREVSGRMIADHGLRTLRYRLQNRLASDRWRHVNGASATWRRGCTVLGMLLGIEHEQISEVIGKRWAWDWREPIMAFGRHWLTCMAAARPPADCSTVDERIARSGKLYRAIVEWEAQQKEGECAK